MALIKKVVEPEKIILYGDYAKGKTIDDANLTAGPSSEYDFLIVRVDGGGKESELSGKIVCQAQSITQVPVNCILHDIAYINEGLLEGQRFFIDIITDGVLLHDEGKAAFAEPQLLSPAEEQEKAQASFKRWHGQGSALLRYAQFAFEDAQKHNLTFNNVAFLLHQAAECFFITILLVSGGYKPRTHNLLKLRQYAKTKCPELLEIFPQRPSDEYEHHLFDLLRRGYIDARYRKDFVITEEEAVELMGRVERMRGVVEGAGIIDFIPCSRNRLLETSGLNYNFFK